jgi:N-acetylglucosamine repressor
MGLCMQNDSHLTILQNLRRSGNLTRRDLAQQMGLGLSMVSRLTGELLELGLIRENGRSESQGGRPSDLLSIEPRASYAAGLDIGGNHQRAVLVDLVGNLVTSLEYERNLPPSREGILADIDSLICQLQAQAAIPWERIQGLGIGLWGSVDPHNGVVYSWTETPELYTTWKDYALRDALQARHPFPHIYLDDIVRTMGLAEVLYGSSNEHDHDFIFALADTGIGVAVMIDGQPYVGPTQLSGEIGHIPIAGGDILCSCGNTGCLETIASSRAVIDQVKRKMRESSVISRLRFLEETMTVQQIIQAAEEGDKLAFQVLTEAGEKFGVGLAITANLLGPRWMVVGGSLAASNVFLDATRRMVRMQALSKVNSSLTIEASKLNHLAGSLGAASQVLNLLFSSGENNLLTLVTR